jgi:hypothetical protein
MFLYPNSRLTDLDDLFPSNADGASIGKAEEALQSHIIMGFEEALSLGMTPMEALSHVLCWVASEMTRISSGQEPGRAVAPDSSRDG